MGNKKLIAWCLGAWLLVSAGLAAHAQEHASNKAAQKDQEQSLSELAEEAYVYTYPLVVLDQTAKVATNVAMASSDGAPINQFARVKTLPDASFDKVVLPNVDTLYTSAFLDLGAEPIVLHVPNTEGRYYLMPMLDAYTNVFAAPGKRTTGTGELNVAIVGPTFKGELPAGLSKIQAPTDRVWILGRTQINGKEELAKVAALTDRYSLTPLSSFRKPYTPKVNDAVDPKLDMKTPAPVVVSRMSDRAYFERVAELLGRFPPPESDREFVEGFQKLGLTPGRFTPSPAAQKAIQGTGKRATKAIRSRVSELGKDVQGWRVPVVPGAFGAGYQERAAIALWALGANLREDAVYPAAMLDVDGKALNGKGHDYLLHFARGQEPPANAFWSITMYNQDGYFVENPIDRYAIRSSDQLRRNPDGSLDILVQHERPKSEAEVNWLPAPKGPFQLIMRLYWPKDSVLTGTWEPPSVQRLKR